jgi:hypothetical protein
MHELEKIARRRPEKKKKKKKPVCVACAQVGGRAGL